MPNDCEVDRNEFKMLMEVVFWSRPTKEAIIFDFISPKPQDIPVAQVIKAFNRQLLYVPDLAPRETAKIHHFKMRMKPEIQVYMFGFGCTTICQDKALAYEMYSA